MFYTKYYRIILFIIVAFNVFGIEEKPVTVDEGCFYIIGNPRNGSHKEISIPIAHCSHIELSPTTLMDVFDLANHYTLNTQYPCDVPSPVIDGKVIHRPNHNGTHSLRQVRLIEALFDLIEQEGTDEGRDQLVTLTDEEKINIKMAAFFLRAGRVDESSHKDPLPDDYNTRSAMIYEAYAEQLGVDPQIRQWIRNLIFDSCKPLEICIEATKSSKSLFVYSLLTTAHECDLVRCFGKYEIEKNKSGCFSRMYSYINNPYVQVESLFEWTIKLCKATGNRIVYSGWYGDSKLFARCSLQAKTCWNKLSKIEYPSWNNESINSDRADSL